jgi:hypothetical protein
MNLSLETIALIAVIVIIVVVVAGFFIIQAGSSIKQMSECKRNGGVCTYSCQSGSVSTFKCENGIEEETESTKIMTIGLGDVVCCLVQ